MLGPASFIPRPQPILRAALSLATAFVVLGCNAGVPPATVEPPTEGSPAASFPDVIDKASLAPPTDDELQAIQFRIENSLPADLEHVRAVAADPTADTAFGVPLLPSEFEELMSRSANIEELIPIIQAEAAKAPKDYCGLYIDNANEGALTSGWKANRLIHELAIRSAIRPGANVAFIDCRFSEPEVDRVCELLRTTDHDWMKAIPAQVQGWGCGNKNFRVEMQISSAVPDAADRVLSHYTKLFGLPPGILVVQSDGTGATLVPWGEVRVFVNRPDGRPLGDAGFLMLLWESEEPGLACGIMDMGFGVGGDKPTKLPCQAGRWTIKVAASIDDIYGQGTVVVKADQTVDLHITLDRNPPG